MPSRSTALRILKEWSCSLLVSIDCDEQKQGDLFSDITQQRNFMSPKRLSSKIAFWNVRHLFRKIHIGLQCNFLCCLSQSILNVAVFPASDHTAPFSSFDSAPKTNILVQNEVPQHPRPVLVVWQRIIELFRYVM